MCSSTLTLQNGVPRFVARQIINRALHDAVRGKCGAKPGAEFRVRLDGDQPGDRRILQQHLGDLADARAHFQNLPAQRCRKLPQQGVPVIFASFKAANSKSSVWAAALGMTSCR